jgi:uncharacterized protein YecE (DUF72 family)
VQKTGWHIGCSGFHYKEWKGVFYPDKLPSTKWFAFYTEHFNTLELNVTFYRFPTLSQLQGWHEKAPEAFTFSAKVPRQVTHYQKFKGTESLLHDFYSVLQEGLGDKLGCVLFQLPPSFSFAEDKLEMIMAQTNPAFNNVIEFRHASWWRADVQQQLTAAGISFSGVSFPGIFHDEAIVNTPLAYYRFHGVPLLFHSPYDEAFLSQVAGQLNEAAPREAYVYFNNTALAAALENARTFKRLINS